MKPEDRNNQPGQRQSDTTKQQQYQQQKQKQPLNNPYQKPSQDQHKKS